MKKFVLSSSAFETKQQAETKITRWFKDGSFNPDVKLYKIVEVYEPRLKFVKIKDARKT